MLNADLPTGLYIVVLLKKLCASCGSLQRICLLTGLERGLAGEPAEFTIVTKDAGPGGLALAVHGPSKAEITCQDNGDGTCSVKYLPDEPGRIREDNLHVTGSKRGKHVDDGFGVLICCK